jgi:galactokinase
VTDATAVEAPAAEYRLGEERRQGKWIDYVAGVTHVARAEGLPLRGADLRVTSDVPVGAGLASSAALEVAVLRAVRRAYRWTGDDGEIARLAWIAETRFVGVPVGVMDQMAASLGERSSALFLDTQRLTWERVALPADAELAVVHSGVRHSHATGAYAGRRAECEQAAALLGVKYLAALAPGDVPRLDGLPDVLRRRARHVVSEEVRVTAAVEALRAADIVGCGRLMDESHASMRDDYAVSTPAIDVLVAATRGEAGVVGARLTGGGCGGCIVIMAHSGFADAAAASAVGASETATRVA